MDYKMDMIWRQIYQRSLRTKNVPSKEVFRVTAWSCHLTFWHVNYHWKRLSPNAISFIFKGVHRWLINKVTNDKNSEYAKNESSCNTQGEKGLMTREIMYMGKRNLWWCHGRNHESLRSFTIYSALRLFVSVTLRHFDLVSVWQTAEKA